MKIDICSDLHVPLNGSIQWSKIKNKDSTILVVAGDTSNSIFKTADVLNSASLLYDKVIAVLGNHDFYDYASPDNGIDAIGRLAKGNVDVLGGS